MKISINTIPKKYITAYLLILNPIMKLKPMELKVLRSIILVWINLKKEIGTNGTMTEDEIDKRINEPIGRKIIADNIKISRNSFNNYYMLLKRKKVITSDNKLSPFLKIDLFKPETNITYQILINNTQNSKESNNIKSNGTTGTTETTKPKPEPEPIFSLTT